MSKHIFPLLLLLLLILFLAAAVSLVQNQPKGFITKAADPNNQAVLLLTKTVTEIGGMKTVTSPETVKNRITDLKQEITIYLSSAKELQIPDQKLNDVREKLRAIEDELEYTKADERALDLPVILLRRKIAELIKDINMHFGYRGSDNSMQDHN